MQNAPSRSLDPSGLATAVKEVGAIFDEFSRIPSVLPTLDDIPTGAESKNRYANVIPMPDTRVLLTFQDDQPNSDYINANFVQVTFLSSVMNSFFIIFDNFRVLTVQRKVTSSRKVH